jgi:hypothetical protein
MSAGTSRVRTTSAIGKIQKQASQLLSNLTSQIRSMETDLRRLRETELTLLRLTGSQPASLGGRVTTRGTGAGARINWRTVLEQMPKQFKAADVRKVRRLKYKRPSEIFAAITRWTEAGSVKRKKRGLYARVS